MNYENGTRGANTVIGGSQQDNNGYMNNAQGIYGQQK
jgi:hypothetical protein